MTSSEKEFKILALCIPAMGHLYPMTSLVSAVAKQKNVKVIMYGNIEHKELIESTKAEFRHFQAPGELDDVMLENIKKHRFPLDRVLNEFIDVAEAFLPELLRCVEEDEIDLILFDFFSVYAKWLMKYLRNQHKKGKLSRPPPKAVMSSASFIVEKGIYPNSYEMQHRPSMSSSLSIKMVFNLILVMIKYVIFCFKYGLEIESLTKTALEHREEINLCTIVPEIQPRAHLLPKSIKFIGSCACKSQEYP